MLHRRYRSCCVARLYAGSPKPDGVQGDRARVGPDRAGKVERPVRVKE